MRSRVTKGCHIKLSMLDAMVAFLWPEGMMNYTLIEDRASGSPEGQIAQDLVFRTLDGFITVFWIWYSSAFLSSSNTLCILFFYIQT